jgi:adenylate cyclase
MQGDFRLGDWLIHPALCRLSKDGQTVQVRAKVMDLLTYLADHSGEVIPKDRLLDDVWGTRDVSESTLTRTVTELRQALGDDAGQPRLLETIQKRGYRLIAPVVPLAALTRLTLDDEVERERACEAADPSEEDDTD